MNIFEKASKTKLRFFVPKYGNAMVEDLYDLSLPSLNVLAKEYSKLIKEAGEESFIEESSVDPVVQLKFDIVKSVIDSKIAQNKKTRKASDTRKKNQKVLEIMGRKKDIELESKTWDELEELLEAED